jgi:hypothetical protein
MRNLARGLAGALLTASGVVGSMLVAALPVGATPQAPVSTPVLCTPTAAMPCPSPPLQPGGLDHFLCYPVTADEFTPPLVQVTDQFGQLGPFQPLPASKASGADPNLFCNPVEKILLSPTGVPTLSYPVGNPQAHLYCFGEPASAPVEQNWVVSNQFGSETVTVLAPFKLCLPSWKFDPNASPTNDLAAAGSVPQADWTDSSNLALNHFECYKVSAAAFPDEPTVVALHDQFGTYNALLGLPTALCAPAVKQVVDTQGHAVGPPSQINSDGFGGAHLLCYAVREAGNGHGVVVGNQFSQAAGATAPAAVPVTLATLATQLCLPSFKTPLAVLPEAPLAVALPLVGVASGAAFTAVALRRRNRRGLVRA